MPTREANIDVLVALKTPDVPQQDDDPVRARPATLWFSSKADLRSMLLHSPAALSLSCSAMAG
jgi:hypothetical protein